MVNAKIWCAAKAGIFLTILSSFAHATGNLFSKYLSNKIDVFNIVAVRYIFQCLFAVPTIAGTAEDMKDVTKIEWTLIFASGLFQMISSACAFISLTLLPIMDATTLIKIQPIFVNLLSWIWLKEMITWLDFMMTVVLMGGVILVCEPAFIFGAAATAVIQEDSTEWIGQLLAIGAALTAGIATCMVRRVRNAGTSIIIFWQGVIIVTVSLIAGFFLGVHIEPTTIVGYLLLLGAAIGESLYRILLTAALMVEESAIVASFQTVEILFSLIYELGVYKLVPDLLNLTGAILIVAGVIILSFKYKIVQAARCRNRQSASSTLLVVDEKSKLVTV